MPVLVGERWLHHLDLLFAGRRENILVPYDLPTRLPQLEMHGIDVRPRRIVTVVTDQGDRVRVIDELQTRKELLIG
jgi:hypothetical protein